MDPRQAQRRKEIWEALQEANPRAVLILVIAVSIPFWAVALFFVGAGLREIDRQAELITQAVEVPATVVDSRVITAQSPPSRRRYLPEVEYAYEFSGAELRSSSVWPHRESVDYASAQQIAERYPPGAIVTALVDPQNPATAFLERKWSAMPYLGILVGLYAMLFTTFVGLLLVGWKRPSSAFFVASVMSLFAAGLVIWAGAHYFTEVPVAQRRWWMGMLLAAGFAMPAGPWWAARKSRRLHEIYRDPELAIS